VLSQVREVENLPDQVNLCDRIPLVCVAGYLHIAESVLNRYFWGINKTKGGPPITANQAEPVEDQLRLNFATDSVHKLNAQAAVNTSASQAPGKVKAPALTSAFPLHTSKTGSGLAAIYDFGDMSATGVSGSEWQYSNQLLPSSPVYQLRPGMRGRHIFGRRSKELADKCFEWTIHRDKLNCGRPLWQLSEFECGNTRLHRARWTCCLKSQTPEL
jgi:hypothetical protein